MIIQEFLTVFLLLRGREIVRILLDQRILVYNCTQKSVMFQNVTNLSVFLLPNTVLYFPIFILLSGNFFVIMI